jgi:hypothetical protein
MSEDLDFEQELFEREEAESTSEAKRRGKKGKKKDKEKDKEKDEPEPEPEKKPQVGSSHPLGKNVRIPIVVSTLDYSAPKPYFFQNDIISKKNKYIAQPADSLESALYILDIWNSEKYNIGPDMSLDFPLSTIVHIPFIKYVYHSNSRIGKFVHELRPKKDVPDSFDHTKKPEDYKILVYKKNSKLYYLALLKI